MRKAVAVLVVLFIGVILIGCPTTPVTPIDPVIPPTQETGSFSVSGHVYIPDVAKDGDSGCRPQIGEAMKYKASWISFSLNPVVETEPPEPIPTETTGKGGGGGWDGNYFTLPVIDGYFSGQCNGIFLGVYTVYVYIYDNSWSALFYGQTEITIERGEVVPLYVTMEMFKSYSFKATIADLPGYYVFNEWGLKTDMATVLISYDGADRQLIWWQVSEKGDMSFYTYLPLDYQGGTLIITDTNGDKWYADFPLNICELDWDTFQFSDLLSFPYQPSDRLGGFEVIIDFDFN